MTFVGIDSSAREHVIHIIADEEDQQRSFSLTKKRNGHQIHPRTTWA
jgi:hypothetical protein